MKIARYIIGIALIGIFMFGYAFAQQTGDYRSFISGSWSDSSKWEIYNGTEWVAATTVPTGNEKITIDGLDTMTVDIAVTISDTLVLMDDADIIIYDGSMEFNDGGVYTHARDGGSIPLSTWNTGSTALITGIVSTAPDNRGQDYYNLIFNTPGLVSNRDMNLNGHTISGDITVISTGSARWQLVGGSSGTVIILGDVNVLDGQFATQGTGSATDVIINHYGDINVSGGNFSISRGSQSSGTGTTTWNLLGGNFSMSDATTQNSNPTPGNAKFVFASADTQQITFSNVTYSGDVHFKVADSTTLEINGDFEANGLFVNEGEVDVLGTLTFSDGAVYEHARDGGSIPIATWGTGSTALITGITSTAPADRGQDYYNLTFNTPGLGSNRDMSLNDHTISGDITVISTGTARWQMVGGSSGTVTIMGDVIVQDGQFATQGTGSVTDVVVDHFGDIIVTGGNFSIGRGSQGSGAGTTRWYLHEGNFNMSNAITQNSNPAGATFVFSNENAAQSLTLSNVTYGGGGLPIAVDSLAILALDTTVIGGNGNFVLSAAATLSTALVNGLDDALQTSGTLSFSKQSNFTFNGIEAQVPGLQLPDTLGILTISNPAGVTFNDTLLSSTLVVSAAALMTVDTSGNVTADTGAVAGTVVNKGVLDVVGSLVFSNGSVYEHARDEGSIPNGVWEEGSTALITGVTSTAPANRGQDYYNLTFNSPGLLSNRDMNLNDHTISGDITVINTGSARWQMVGGSSGTVTIMGDVIVQDGTFATQGTGSATDVIVDHYGDINVTGGNFSVSRGSQGSGTGSTRWYIHDGNFSMQNATTQNSNSANAWFVFDKDTVQTIELTNVTYGGGGLAIEVADGTTLDFGGSILGGNGLFTLNSGAVLATAHKGGVDSTLQSTGNVTLSKSASFVFNGSEAQITGILMPDTLNNLTIDNSAGVTLSQITLVDGVLKLVSGIFDNTIPVILGINGSVSLEGGSLLLPITGLEDQPSAIPVKFALYQNYPNPFNPSTTIRYDVPKQARVTMKVYDATGREVAELVNKQQVPGAYSVVWNASEFASGLYYYRIVAGDFVSVQKLVLIK